MMMYVYLKFGTSIKVVNNVTIDEDCGPVVNGKLVYYSSENSGSAVPTKSTIDAISWFKSLPVEAVYIDCSVRDAKWCPKLIKFQDNSPKRCTENPHHQQRTGGSPAVKEEVDVPFMPASGRPLFADHPGVLDFNPVVDEMFERAEELCLKWESLSERGEINEEIAKILHCYVFPAVSFQKEDLPVLQECLRVITSKQAAIEKEIMDVEKSIEVTEKFLHRQKEVILASETMTTQAYLKACGKDFVEMFYFHIIRDIQNKNMKLDILQMKVNDLKKSSQQGENLEKLQTERDALHDSMQKLMAVREAIRNHLYRPFVSNTKVKKQKKVKIDEKERSLHTSFEKVHQKLTEDKDDLKKLCYRKLHTASIREAIESTIKMLKRESPGVLGDFSEFSILCNAMEAEQKEWQSMQTRVDMWMTSDSRVFSLHMDGCQLIKDLAESVLSETQLPSMGLDPAQIVVQNAEDTPSHSVNEDIINKRAPMVQVIKEQVCSHSTDVAEKIVKMMKFDSTPGSRHINRAWMCYESHMWREIGQAVVDVYTHYHDSQARDVHRLASSTALADIMDSNFFRQCFPAGRAVDSESKDSVSAQYFRSADTISTVSLDLQRCSLTDLYALANRDGARLNCQMLDLETISQSVSSIGTCSGLSGPDCCENDGSNGEGSRGIRMVYQLAEQQDHESYSTSDSGTSVHSDDLFSTDGSFSDHLCDRTESIRSSQTVASVLGLFESIVEPYQEKVQQVLKAQSIMEKLRAVWQSINFLSMKTGEICKEKGMDSLLPMSIFATASFPEDLFVKYFIQLMILTDLKPSFALHSVYDFSLTSAFSTYLYLFEAKFSNRVLSGESCS